MGTASKLGGVSRSKGAKKVKQQQRYLKRVANKVRGLLRLRGGAGESARASLRKMPQQQRRLLGLAAARWQQQPKQGGALR